MNYYEISNDDFGSFDWSVERSFHMMLRRQGGKETFLSIPPAALSDLPIGQKIQKRFWDCLVTCTLIKNNGRKK